MTFKHDAWRDTGKSRYEVSSVLMGTKSKVSRVTDPGTMLGWQRSLLHHKLSARAPIAGQGETIGLFCWGTVPGHGEKEELA